MGRSDEFVIRFCECYSDVAVDGVVGENDDRLEVECESGNGESRLELNPKVEKRFAFLFVEFAGEEVSLLVESAEFSVDFKNVPVNHSMHPLDVVQFQRTSQTCSDDLLFGLHLSSDKSDGRG